MSASLESFLFSRPLLPETDQSHLQKVLSAMAQTIDTLHGRIGQLEQQNAKASEAHEATVTHLTTQVKTLESTVEGLKHTHETHTKPLRWEMDDLKREAELRQRAVTEALGDLATRVDGKVDDEAALQMVAPLQDAHRRLTLDADTIRKSAAAAEDTAKRAWTDLEQLKLAQHSKDRQWNEKVAQVEGLLDSELKRAQAAWAQGARGEVEELRQTLTTRVGKVEREVEEAVAGQARHVELLKRLQHDVAGVVDAQEHSEGDLRSLVARHRDDTDQKLLELLNAVQGVEHAKAVFERQVAEAGRILCGVADTVAIGRRSHTPIPVPGGIGAAGDSPPIPRLAPQRARSGGASGSSAGGGGGVEALPQDDGPAGEKQQQQTTTATTTTTTTTTAAATTALSYKASPAQGVLCSCDDDIF